VQHIIQSNKEQILSKTEIESLTMLIRKALVEEEVPDSLLDAVYEVFRAALVSGGKLNHDDTQANSSLTFFFRLRFFLTD